MAAAFQPSDNLRSRTYIGLIVAQFLAAFNDQAIHASSMFFAIHKEILSEAQAISLMPILFYAPWAIFSTLAGYLADRYSKRDSLVFWKFIEIGITLVAFLGFWIGTGAHGHIGPWLVLSTVFLMGTHSAFFVPAKYGAMPEILTPERLSMGNGILESTSFLAVILGTVSGGTLSFYFRRQEYWIGVILIGLALIGAAASLLIRRMPAANPSRVFPANPARPLLDNLRVLSRSRPLALAVLGIAFFTFMVAFMRATMYMHGESQIPRWDELQTSLVVATVALGVGLGSPLAGKLSGNKVELGLVPLGAIGMIVTCLIAAIAIFDLSWLIASLVLIGFFSGFYIVPLYTLLQHRAPKTSKGDLIATSNFINVTGAILASLLFFVLVEAAKVLKIARPIAQQETVAGRLWSLQMRRGHAVYFEVRETADSPPLLRAGTPREGPRGQGKGRPPGDPNVLLEVDEDLRDGDSVKVSDYELRKVKHYVVRRWNAPLEDAYDQELVPRFLFTGASVMTLIILLVLCRRLPDFLIRSLLWLRSLGRARARVVGFNNLPADGPVILATNCDRFETCMSVVAATDRFTRFVLMESSADPAPRPLLRYLARRTGLICLKPPHVTPDQRERALASAARSLDQGNLLAVTAEGSDDPSQAEDFLRELRERNDVPIMPVYCGSVSGPPVDGEPNTPRLRVVIGSPLPREFTERDVRRSIRMLGEWLSKAEHAGQPLATVMIPGAAGASPTERAKAPLKSPSPG